KDIRFDNPQFSFTTTFDVNDFKDKLVNNFKVPQSTVDDFFTTVRGMDYFQDNKMTARELFDRFFPGRSDVVRLLMEPITYANGSTLDDPAISYGIVFSNFMSKGVFTFEGGTDKLIGAMKAELEKNGVDIALRSRVEKILTNGKAVSGVIVNGREIKCKAVVSNANIVTTVNDLCGRANFSEDFLKQFDTVRINNSSSQVYMGIKKGEKIDFIGDLIFTSFAPEFSSSELIDKNTSSRTFSVYYPKTRPGHDMYSIVSSTNSNYDDWAKLSKEDYHKEKEALIERSIKHLEKYVPDVRKKIDYVEAATPLTFKRYTLHPGGSSFGTKFEGLKPSMEIGNEVGGLFHTGSVGIIMSGW
ncbi:MAG TPA: FAD-dependent oxidoreductase, partial [Candidatus Wallbacteria bacterium]|nr:FAD-dependent oxidoreductase [Candidatus Wallbacteria bacterium]